MQLCSEHAATRTLPRAARARLLFPLTPLPVARGSEQPDPPPGLGGEKTLSTPRAKISGNLKASTRQATVRGQLSVATRCVEAGLGRVARAHRWLRGPTLGRVLGIISKNLGSDK